MILGFAVIVMSSLINRLMNEKTDMAITVKFLRIIMILEVTVIVLSSLVGLHINHPDGDVTEAPTKPLTVKQKRV